MNKLTTYVPRRTANGDLLVVNGDHTVWLQHTGDEITRQVFVLANGVFSIQDINTVLQQPEEVIQDALQTLLNAHYITLLSEKRKLVSDIESLKETWEKITDKTGFAERFYSLLLAVFPVAKPLFSKTDWQSQYNLLMASIDYMVKGIKYGRNILPSLHLLGARHDYFGVAPVFYIPFNACLLITLQKTFGADFGTGAQDIWSSTVEVVSTEMIKGTRPHIHSLFSHILPTDESRPSGSSVRPFAWSPDKRFVAASDRDSIVQVWDVSNGLQLLTYRGHSGIVQAVAWSPDGRFIASGGRDRTVRVWNASDGSLVSFYKGHSSAVRAITWSPDGKRISSIGQGEMTRVWDISDGSDTSHGPKLRGSF